MKEKDSTKNEKYTERITVRYTAAEMKKIRTKAEETNLDPSVFIRKGSLNTRIVSRTDNLTLAQLRKIGNNINQIARIVNAEKTAYRNVEGIAKAIEDLQTNLRTVLEKLK